MTIRLGDLVRHSSAARVDMHHEEDLPGMVAVAEGVISVDLMADKAALFTLLRAAFGKWPIEVSPDA